MESVDRIVLFVSVETQGKLTVPVQLGVGLCICLNCGEGTVKNILTDMWVHGAASVV